MTRSFFSCLLLFRFLIAFLGAPAAIAVTTAGCNTAQRGEADDDDPKVDASVQTDACAGDSEICGAVCNNNGRCDTGETTAACPTECPDTNLWWARSCGPDCIEIDSAFSVCSHQHFQNAADTLHCQNLTPDERITLRSAAPEFMDVGGACGPNITGWGAPGDFNPTTQAGSKRVRLTKTADGWYRLTRAMAGSAPGSTCNVNLIWPRSGLSYADIDCDAAQGRYQCWSQGANNSLIGVGTHLGGPFSHGIAGPPPSGEIALRWGAAGQPPVPAGQLPNGP